MQSTPTAPRAKESNAPPPPDFHDDDDDGGGDGLPFSDPDFPVYREAMATIMRCGLLVPRADAVPGSREFAERAAVVPLDAAAVTARAAIVVQTIRTHLGEPEWRCLLAALDRVDLEHKASGLEVHATFLGDIRNAVAAEMAQ